MGPPPPPAQPPPPPLPPPVEPPLSPRSRPPPSTSSRTTKSSSSSSSRTRGGRRGVGPPAPPPPPPNVGKASSAASNSNPSEQHQHKNPQHHPPHHLKRWKHHGHVIVPLIKRPSFLRMDTLPFAILYLSLILLDYMFGGGVGGATGSTDSGIGFDTVDFEGEEDMGFVAASVGGGSTTTTTMIRTLVNWTYALVLTIHFVLFLSCQWSVILKARVGYTFCSKLILPGTEDDYYYEEMERAKKKKKKGSKKKKKQDIVGYWTHCLVIPPPNCGDPEIVMITHSTGSDNVDKYNDDNNGAARIVFQQVSFMCRVDGKCHGDDIWESTTSMTTVSSSDRTGNDLPEFHRLHFPVDLPLSFYVKRWGGHATSLKDENDDQEKGGGRTKKKMTTERGLSSTSTSTKTASLEEAREIYGDNTLNIPTPQFLHILLPQLVAPFFVFQILCVLLWSLDEYWYYALFTLFTLVLFECTVAYNRLKSLSRLRETLREPYPVMCYRDDKWDWCISNELVCGDLVSVTRGTGPLHMLGGGGQRMTRRERHHRSMADGAAGSAARQIPADLLLLNGTAVVDESMLTGESVPQMKEALSLDEEDEESNRDGSSSSGGGGVVVVEDESHLDAEDPKYKRSLLFAGTTCVDHSSSASSGTATAATTKTKQGTSGTNIAGAAPPQPPPDGGAATPPQPPPDGGAVAFVLRTSFETTQGQLLRTMIHASAKGGQGGDGVNTADTFVFIFILLLCALFSASIVVIHGWYDETRNKFKLILHVVIIVTSVVPPELPMELSLAVTSSLSDLISKQIYCTEPFRIPLAGRVTVCAFDKTGTLTSDEMRLRGLRLAPPENRVVGAQVGDIKCSDGTKHGSNSDLVEAGDSVLPRSALRAMVACQSLAWSKVDNQVIGDPLEKAVLKGCKWTLKGNTVVIPEEKEEGEDEEEDGDNDNDDDKDDKQLKRKKRRNAKMPPPVIIYHRFPFESRLKRMTVIAKDDDSCCDDDKASGRSKSKNNLYALSKGAPEVMKGLLSPTSIPTNYDKVYRYHMGRGQRVLCLAQRDLGFDNVTKLDSIKEKGRGYMERELSFVAFLIFDCPLKSDSWRVVNELKASAHRTVMITGDSALTACEVARQVGIIDTGPKDTYDLREMKRVDTPGITNDPPPAARSSSSSNSGSSGATDPQQETAFAFVPVNAIAGEYSPKDCIAFVPNNIAVLKDMVKSSELALCVSGEVLTRVAIAAVKRRHYLKQQMRRKKGKRTIPLPSIDGKTVLLESAAQNVLQMLVPCVSVFARCAPRQKEAVIAALNGAGGYTLMCGDGTNDVGALKQAHVGISIVSVPEIEAKQREASDVISKIKAEERAEKKAQKKMMKKKGKGGNDSGEQEVVPSSPTRKELKKKRKKKKKTLEQSLRELAETQEELSFVSLGDASIASPFTSRAMSIGCCRDILRQGRCTLVTMLQIYKILGVNCLVNALVLSKLHMHGVKQGDRQLTAVGVVVAALFLFVTKGKPLSTLSSQRPPSSVLCIQALISIASQFVIHFIAILLVTDMSMPFLDPDDPSITPDGPFNPNPLNTSTFLLTVLATVNTFVVNYRGRPYMQSLKENKFLYRSAMVCFVMLFTCALEIFEPLNQLLQLSPLPHSVGVLERMVFNSGGGEEINGDGENSTKYYRDDDEIVILGEGHGSLLFPIIKIFGFKIVLGVIMILDTIISYRVEKAIVKKFEK